MKIFDKDEDVIRAEFHKILNPLRHMLDAVHSKLLDIDVCLRVVENNPVFEI